MNQQNKSKATRKNTRKQGKNRERKRKMKGNKVKERFTIYKVWGKGNWSKKGRVRQRGKTQGKKVKGERKRKMKGDKVKEKSWQFTKCDEKTIEARKKGYGNETEHKETRKNRARKRKKATEKEKTRKRNSVKWINGISETRLITEKIRDKLKADFISIIKAKRWTTLSPWDAQAVF